MVKTYDTFVFSFWKLTTPCRFCKICYFFEDEGQKSLHGQWFTHGSKTLLQETAHTKALFLMNSCNDMPVAAIYQKCNFRWLRPDELEPDDNNPELENDFHCGYVIDVSLFRQL